MSDAIDDFLDNLEKMIDAQDDMWEEEKYSNYRQVAQIKSERYEPAKHAAKDGLAKLITQIVRRELGKSPSNDYLDL